ncbi:MAG: hypothetical protein A2289_15055 [Deltaproteobacteria bacterium RIFOXYA12_FULL_58_15]|nr:MAG: hypothetical protein A2289_15055 [Deltaproteobacteria bacterium RIFOXYA12_FULL_58_15]OGR13041.1 MAG: hypothetical protein A2341_08255 [Deltaproteobacteria bacterium RIFOXYB12_FULL_58_9]
MFPSDASLIARVIQDDDRHAFAQLVRRHQSQVRSVLRRLTCGNQALSDDLAQETFIRAYRGIKTYRGGGKFSSWLYRIAYNVFLTERTHNQREAVDSEPLTTLDGGRFQDKTTLRHDLMKAMKHLTEQERAAIALAYGAEATHEEIAVVLECPLGTAKSHIARGKEKLKNHLRAWANAE